VPRRPISGKKKLLPNVQNVVAVFTTTTTTIVVVVAAAVAAIVVFVKNQQTAASSSAKLENRWDSIHIPACNSHWIM